MCSSLQHQEAQNSNVYWVSVIPFLPEKELCVFVCVGVFKVCVRVFKVCVRVWRGMGRGG